MANIALVNIDKLDADMLSLADKIRAKGNTTEKLEWPAGYEAAVEALNSIQTKSGQFYTGTNGTAVVNCGFKPDLVTIHVGSYEGYAFGISFPFSDFSNDNVNSVTWNTAGLPREMEATRHNNGFSVEVTDYDANWATSKVSASFKYTAHKFTA